MGMVQLLYNAKMMDHVIAKTTSMGRNAINAWKIITTFLLVQVISIAKYCMKLFHKLLFLRL